MNRDAIEWFKAVKYSNTDYITAHMDSMFDLRDENGNTGLMHAAYYGNTAVVHILAERSAKLLNTAKKTALMQCICSDYNLGRASVPDIVDTLKHYEAGVSDERGCTALMMAAERGDIRSVAALVEYEHGQKDVRGRTALMYAASFGKTECVPALLVETSEVDNKGMTALMFAAYSNNVQIIRQLIRYESRQRNKNNETALIIAISQGREEAVSELAASEKDIYYGSISPYQFAINLQQNGCALILQPHNTPIPSSAVDLSLQDVGSTRRIADIAPGSAYPQGLMLSASANNQPQIVHTDTDALRQIQVQLRTLQQRMDVMVARYDKVPAPAAVSTDKPLQSNNPALLADIQRLTKRIEDQDATIRNLQTALQQSQLETRGLKESHSATMKRIVELEKSTADTRIQLALGATSDQPQQSIDEIMGHLRVLNESISNLDARNHEEHRELNSKLSVFQTELLRIAQTESGRTIEINALREKFGFLHDELIKVSVSAKNSMEKASSLATELEAQTKVQGAHTTLLSSLDTSHSSSSVSRAIVHLHEELRVVKNAIENVGQSLATMHNINMQNLDTLMSSHASFVANYPTHKHTHDEMKLLEELQEKIIRIDHYMADSMREDRLAAIMSGFVELSGRVDQLVVDQSKCTVENISGRIEEIERTLDAVLTVLNVTPEEKAYPSA